MLYKLNFFLLIFFLYFLIIFSLDYNEIENKSYNEIFSGFYAVNSKIATNDFAAAYISSRKHFILSKNKISNSRGMAGATFSVIRNKYWNTEILNTKDILDFCVEHLSSFSNKIPKAFPVLFDSEIYRMSKNILQYRLNLKKFAIEKNKQENYRSKQTAGILIYSSNSFSTDQSIFQSRMRYYYFILTFLSAYKHFDDIFIFVASEEDEKNVKSMDLPFKQIFNLQIPRDEKNRTTTLPRDSLLYFIDKLENNHPDFLKYKYIYYSEGDQIVHIRGLNNFYDIIDNSFDQFLIVPHRLQVSI